MSVTVNHSTLRVMLEKMIPARLPLLITGKPGIGKTDTVETVCAALGFDLVLEHPAVCDPTDYKGLPWASQGDTVATFLPYGNLAAILKATRPTVWFFDDLGQATPATQSATMQLFLARRINGHIIPDCVTFVAATNRRVDRAGVSGILEPVKSRFVSIVELDVNIDDWSKWAKDAGIPAHGIAFLRYREELLCKFEPTSDLTNSPLPRTWANLFKLEALNFPLEIESAAMAGAVGEGAALEYLAFRSMYRSLVNLDAILMDPSNAAIPSKTSELYAVAVGLASRANETNFGRIATYANRMAVDAGKGEFAVLLVRDAVRRDAKIQYSDAYVRLNAGPLGQLVSGR